MRCYTTETLGIRTSPHPTFGRVLTLGEQGRGRVLTTLRIDPAVVLETTGNYQHCVVEAGVMAYGDRREIVAPAEGDEERALVRVSSDHGYTRGRCATVRPYWGEPRLVAQGQGADGDAGRIGSWEDTLWILRPDEGVRVQPNNGKAKPYIVRWTGIDMLRLSPDDFRAWASVWAREAPAALLEEERARAEARCPKLCAALTETGAVAL